MNFHQPAQPAPMQSEHEFLMEAPLLKALDAQLKVCKSQKEWAIIRARQALYLARTHRISEAAAVPGELRKLFRGIEDPEVFIWIWLAEGVVDFYASATTRSKGLLDRAFAVANSMGLEGHAEYAAAWLANSCLRDDDYRNMVHWLSISRTKRARFPETVCRSTIVAAVAFQTIGDDASAVQWFASAREVARRIGDRATLMASIENRALMRLDLMWLRSSLGQSCDFDIGAVESELLGALEYERVTGSDAFTTQGDVARVRLHVLRGDLDLALKELNMKSNILTEGKFPTANALAVIRLWLILVLHRAVNSNLISSELDSLERMIESFDDDDACVSWQFMIRISRILNDSSRIPRYLSKLEKARKVYDQRINYLRSSILGWKANPDSGGGLACLSNQ